jgi:hypothetical protein
LAAIEEMAKCVVLCSNCHKKERFEGEPRSFEKVGGSA